eukprot:NODE_6773_length_484_cov_193.244755.p3 GENE.NODE_6773_length_484_cov_193.244755~~NODE_6773_length_484_cov_193.244755.p3  ORF type:complete len:50 (-),score=10.63 NODE_6773_length_484_cov_193.244755:94-243(-)
MSRADEARRWATSCESVWWWCCLATLRQRVVSLSKDGDVRTLQDALSLA